MSIQREGKKRLFFRNEMERSPSLQIILLFDD
jgi:hypothetical protein